MSIKKCFFIIFLFIIGTFFGATFASENSNSSKKPIYWIDPMEPTIHYDKPGKSRMGMDVVPIYAEDNQASNGAPIVKIDPEVVNNLGVRIETVTKGTLLARVETVGYINPDENAISHVHTYTDGWVKKLMVKAAGEKVAKDQLLLQLYSPTLVNAEEEYLIALGTNNELTAAARKKLLTLGISEKQIARVQSNKKSDQLIDVYAPQAGIISELNIREGMQVNPNTTIMSLADLTNVWLMAEVYESQAQLVAVGVAAEARLTSMPDKILKGQVDYIYPQVDSTTRTLKIRLRFANPDNTLKPGMYANVSLLAKPIQDVISIPQEALIRTGQGDRVIVALGDGRFEPRIVTAGMESGDRIAIIAGLTPGEQVVTSAQFLIDSEANLKGVLERLTSPAKNTINKTEVHSVQQTTNNMSSNTETKKQLTVNSAQDNKSKKSDEAAIDPVAFGTIKAVKAQEHQVKISHQPIKELNWPAMTMDFTVTNEVDLSQLKVGDAVQFNLQAKGDDFVISNIQILTKK